MATICVKGGHCAYFSILAHQMTFDYIFTRSGVLVDDAALNQSGSVVHLAALRSHCLACASPRIWPARLTAKAVFIKITTVNREVIERTRVHLEDAVVGTALLI